MSCHPSYHRHLARLPDTVVWNPWEERAAAMGDLGPGVHQGFLCVEAGACVTPVQVTGGGGSGVRVSGVSYLNASPGGGWGEMDRAPHHHLPTRLEHAVKDQLNDLRILIYCISIIFTSVNQLELRFRN